MNQALVVALSPRVPRSRSRGAKAFSVASLRGHTLEPAPIAVAEFRGGEKIRMSFCQMAGRPWAFAHARRLVAQVIGNERGRAGSAYAAATMDLDRKIAAAVAIAEDPGISYEEADTARQGIERLEKRRLAAIKKARTEALDAFSAKHGRVFPPATDFASFHVEHDGRRIDPLAIEHRQPVKTLSGPRRTRKAVADTVAAAKPESNGHAPPPSPARDVIDRVQAELGPKAVEAFLHAMTEFVARPGKVRAFRNGGFTYRIHVHKKENQ